MNATAVVMEAERLQHSLQVKRIPGEHAKVKWLLILPRSFVTCAARIRFMIHNQSRRHWRTGNSTGKRCATALTAAGYSAIVGMQAS